MQPDEESRFGKLYSGNTITSFLVDSLAAGLPESYIISKYKEYWNYEVSVDDIRKQSHEQRAEIDRRKAEMLAQIERENLVGMIVDIIHDLKGRADRSASTKEMVSILNTLQKYLEFFMNSKQEQNIGTQNVYIQQNTLVAFNWLEKEKVISILDKEKLTRLLDVKSQN